MLEKNPKGFKLSAGDKICKNKQFQFSILTAHQTHRSHHATDFAAEFLDGRTLEELKNGTY